jgi:hypothetical protein
MPRKAWSVGRLWWEFTKLLLAGRGGYEVNLFLRLDDFPDDVRQAVERENWLPVDLSWVGADDRFVVINAVNAVTEVDPDA